MSSNYLTINMKYSKNLFTENIWEKENKVSILILTQNYISASLWEVSAQSVPPPYYRNLYY